MRFDPKTHKVDPETLTQEEAKVFVCFLQSEVMRHEIDIEETTKLIMRINKQFHLE